MLVKLSWPFGCRQETPNNLLRKSKASGWKKPAVLARISWAFLSLGGVTPSLCKGKSISNFEALFDRLHWQPVGMCKKGSDNRQSSGEKFHFIKGVRIKACPVSLGWTPGSTRVWHLAAGARGPFQGEKVRYCRFEHYLINVQYSCTFSETSFRAGGAHLQGYTSQRSAIYCLQASSTARDCCHSVRIAIACNKARILKFMCKSYDFYTVSIVCFVSKAKVACCKRILLVLSGFRHTLFWKECGYSGHLSGVLEQKDKLSMPTSILAQWLL